ncbi:hypothetical protein CsSME_00031334 [Camellia sinensis var. sinensis]
MLPWPSMAAALDSTQNLYVVLGAFYASCLFVGVNNASSVQPIVSIKATRMYSPFPYAAAQVGILILKLCLI